MTRCCGGDRTDDYQLAYDALGRCVKRTLNDVTTLYVYDGEKPIVEYNAITGGIAASNVYGKAIDEILLRTDNSAGQTYYYQQDHEGSVTHVTNAAGAVIESYRYDAFGAPTIRNSSGISIPVSAIGNRFMFTGREYTAKFGIYEYRARAYHPGLGRFMSEDPIGFTAGDYNLFRYCGNDPLDRVDPSGLVDANTMSTFLRADWIANSAGISNADMALLGMSMSPGGDISFASGGNDSAKSMAPQNEGPKELFKGAHQSAMAMLAQETRRKISQAGVITDGPPYRVGPVDEQKVDRHRSHPSLGGYKDQAFETLRWQGTKDQKYVIVHYHARGGREGEPTKTHDLEAVKSAPMYFTNRDWAKEGRYQILRNGQLPETRFDRSIIPAD